MVCYISSSISLSDFSLLSPDIKLLMYKKNQRNKMGNTTLTLGCSYYVRLSILK